eukprot:TRINITY_DN1623_c0_g1_i3.p1 TRINITY_DN1623_c0_g1~~TRINITY_DN1623_c0_g1_i3.p1  ORF type:complete len:108 (+),score=9.10 TRINITY_DN1623_c0_g1_i3:74-397(+)
MLIFFVFASSIVLQFSNIVSNGFIEFQEQAYNLGFWTTKIPSETLIKLNSLNTQTWCHSNIPYSRGKVVYHKGKYYMALHQSNYSEPGYKLHTVLFVSSVFKPSQPC